MTDIFNTLLQLDRPVLSLAPMEGITNRFVRDFIARLGGVDIVATEFFRITGIRQKARPFVKTVAPLQIQIMGRERETIVGCLRYLKEQELILDSDWLDLNVGCPSRRVNSHGAGAALLKDPDRLFEIISDLRSAHTGPLSVKTRLGFESTSEFLPLLRMLSRTDLNFITFHARTRCCSFDEKPQWSFLKIAVQELPFPVIGNGDVWSAHDALSMIEQTGVRGVMCGRGAIANPLIFNDIRERLRGASGSSAEQQRRAILLMLNKLSAAYQEVERRPGSFVGALKEIIFWTSRNPAVGKAFFDQAKRAQSYLELERIATEFLAVRIDVQESAR